jgi:uncharacterized membrane protein YdjX (TVP38/TMEM64 family)
VSSEPESPVPRRALRRILLTTIIVLAVPIVPFLILGAGFEEQVESWFREGLSDSSRFALIVAVLSADIVLPVPSSMVSTYGGAVLGVLPAALASWIGMTIGAILGFAAARAFGRAYVARRTSRDDLAQIEQLSERVGPAAIAITRALPILAEACVLLMGATGLPWRRFLLPATLANLGISLVYAVFGKYFAGEDALPIAIAVSGILPLLAAFMARKFLPRAREKSDESRSQ